MTSQTVSISVQWTKAAIDWTIDTAPHFGLTISSSSSAQQQQQQYNNDNNDGSSSSNSSIINVSPSNLETTSVIHATCRCGPVSEALSSGIKHFKHSTHHHHHPYSSPLASASAFLIEIQRCLFPRVLGQRVSWNSSLVLPRVLDSSIVVDVVDDPEEEFFDHFVTTTSNSSSSQQQQQTRRRLRINDEFNNNNDSSGFIISQNQNAHLLNSDSNLSAAAATASGTFSSVEDLLASTFGDGTLVSSDTEKNPSSLSSASSNHHLVSSSGSGSGLVIAQHNPTSSSSSNLSSSSVLLTEDGNSSHSQMITSNTGSSSSSVGTALAEQSKRITASHYFPSVPTSFVDEMIESNNHHHSDIFTFPIIVGSCSRWLGATADRYKSRQWTLYIRSIGFEDLSLVIDYVVFHFHESFDNPVRVVRQPPFEITEFGWGQFVAFVEIHFKTSAEPNAAPIVVTLNHFIRFDEHPPKAGAPLVSSNQKHCIPPLGVPYTTDKELEMPPVIDGNKDPSVWEEYDEIVIVRPPPSLREALTNFKENVLGKPGQASKTKSVTCKKDIEQHGIPSAKLCDDTQEVQALLKIKKSLTELVEQKFKPRLQLLLGGNTTNQIATSAAATQPISTSNLTTTIGSTGVGLGHPTSIHLPHQAGGGGGASNTVGSGTAQMMMMLSGTANRAWMQWRKKAEDVIASAESQIFDS